MNEAKLEIKSKGYRSKDASVLLNGIEINNCLVSLKLELAGEKHNLVTMVLCFKEINVDAAVLALIKKYEKLEED